MLLTSALPLLFVLHTNPATAQECDAADLESQLNEASPHLMASLFHQLSSCDPTLARAHIDDVFEHILTGTDGELAAVDAIGMGEGDVVRAWVARQLSDERSQTIAHLGDACSGNPAVVQFFVDAHEALGEQFWRERWHRGLADCREPAIQTLLRDALDLDTRDSSRFGAVLEVFSRNLGRAAIPELKALALAASSDEIRLHIVSAFADAAGVGSLEGMNAEAAEDAIAAITDIAPQLPKESVEQARIVLQSLGGVDAANELAAVRFSALQQPDSTFLWGALAMETATCKNGKVQLGIHYGQVIAPGHYWPDQMLDAVDDGVKGAWTFTLASRCKGQSTIEVIVPSQPFADTDAYEAWRDQQLKDVRKREADKQIEFDDDPVVLP